MAIKRGYFRHNRSIRVDFSQGKLEHVAAVPEGIGTSSKRPRGIENDATRTYTMVENRTMPYEQLMDVAMELNLALTAARQQLKELQSKTPLQETNGNRQKPQSTWTPEQVSEKARQMRELAVKGIQRQMKWQPSCKKGSTKWSFEAVAPNKDVFLSMLDLDPSSKPFKLKKVSIGEFQTMFGAISASCRYNYLRITGENVNVHWKEDESTFRLSGTPTVLPDVAPRYVSLFQVPASVEGGDREAPVLKSESNERAAFWTAGGRPRIVNGEIRQANNKWTKNRAPSLTFEAVPSYDHSTHILPYYNGEEVINVTLSSATEWQTVTIQRDGDLSVNKTQIVFYGKNGAKTVTTKASRTAGSAQVSNIKSILD
ncbi:hypothetical protein H2200_009672 [Cladophialophora chaetospira]|uniref:Uncharacterized protein n=1 Tax=Cladophialophora chaetospira TaxID=386627 RepID=A0AA38X2U9_9EURO|nr:hypothetical protein H2200_009672 [Cladophialophora chaetospira]